MRKPTTDELCWTFVAALMTICLFFLLHLKALICWATS